MAITPKEKEVSAVGISVAAGCMPCTNYHVKAAREAGASNEEMRQAVAYAVLLQKSSLRIMEEYAMARLGQRKHEGELDHPDVTGRLKELVMVGVAFAANSLPNLKKHLAAAESVGISQQEIAEILKLAKFIKEKGASHVERLGGLLHQEAA